MPRDRFNPAQAQEVAGGFCSPPSRLHVHGAILLGYPGTTQDVDIYPRKDPENGIRIVAGLRDLGFLIDDKLKEEIISGKVFVQIKSGPFDIDLVFAPDGIENYEKAKSRMDVSSGFPVLSIRDIIASKRSAGRPRDAVELPLLEAFREVYEKLGK